MQGQRTLIRASPTATTALSSGDWLVLQMEIPKGEVSRLSPNTSLLSRSIHPRIHRMCHADECA